MIDEKKLIEVLEEKAKRLLVSVPLTFTEKDIAIGIKSAIRIVKEQPKVDGWISCSERLPEKNGLYLVTQLRYSLDDIDYKRPPLGKEVDYVEYQDGWCGSRIFDVIAWMSLPLPEPWKGE